LTIPVLGARALNGARVTVVGINYWPEETGNAPYTTGLAEHLCARGAQVTVLTGMPYYPYWRVHDRYKRRFRSQETINGVDVRRFRNYIPGRQDAVRRSIFEGTFFLNASATYRLPRPDLVLGIVPSLSGGVIAAQLARRYKTSLGLLFQDLVGSAARQSGMPGGARIADLTARLEGWVARQSDQIAVVSPGFRPYLHGLGVDPDRIVTLRNWSHITPPTADPLETRKQLGWSPEQIVVLHAGAIGLKQGLENVVEAARAAVNLDRRLHFVLMGDGNQRRNLEARATGLPNISFIDPVEKEHFPNVLAAADLLLINERGSVTDMSLPSKLTSYLVAGRPIVAAVNPGGETAREIERSRAGVSVPAEQPRALVNALSALANDAGTIERMSRAGAAYAEAHLSRESALDQAQRCVLDLVHRTVHHARPGTQGKDS
jgi:glycosyltransferase involved in cell wall biosynthesis